MSLLQDALDLHDSLGPFTDDHWTTPIVDAARQLANLDHEAAADALCRFDNDMGPDVAAEGVPCDIHRSAALLALDAALGLSAVADR